MRSNMVAWIATIERLAFEVNRDMPGKSLDARLAEAMKRNRGGMNPKMVREALIRCSPEPSE
jgi:hypothetical protein